MKFKAASPDETGSRRQFLRKPVLAGTALSAFPASAQSPSPPSAGAFFNVRDFGAVPDGSTLNTLALQAAVDACHNAGGGRVLVPPGVYVTGTVRLKSRVTLRVEAGAILRGSIHIADYPGDIGTAYWHPRFSFSREFSGALIWAEGVENIGVEGAGTIDGGQMAPPKNPFPNAGDPERRRPMLLCFHECTGIRVEGITLRHPASFTSYYVACRKVHIQGVTIRSSDTGNGDGIDFDGSQDVWISDCDLDTGDDAISPKTLQPGRPNENFVIANCIIRSRWAAIRLGVESYANMRHFTMSNCVFRDCRDGFKIQLTEDAVMENLTFSNITMEGVIRPFFVTLNSFGMSRYSRSVRPRMGLLRNLRFSNIRAVVPANRSGKWEDQPLLAIVGMPGHPIENVSISGLDVVMPGGGTREQAARMDVPELDDYQKLWPEAAHFEGELPASCLYLRHVREVRMSGVRLAVAGPDARPFIAGDDLENVCLSGVTGYGFEGTPGLLKLGNPAGVEYHDCGVRIAGLASPEGIHEGGAGTNRPVVVELTAEEKARLSRLHRGRAALEARSQREAIQLDATWAATLIALPAAWKFRPDQREEGETGRWFAEMPAAGWVEARIDRSWPEPAAAGWFVTVVTVPSFDPARRLFLYLKEVKGPCKVWLDGEPAAVGEVTPGFGPRACTAELSGSVRPSATHRLTLKLGRETAGGLSGPFELRLGN